VHLRRAILLFALVLGLAALAAAISPTRDSGPALAPAPSGSGAEVVPRTLTFTAGAPGTARVRRARTGEHIVVAVRSEAGGVASIPKLGRTASVGPSSAAQFDLLAPPAGRYYVMIEVSGSSEQRRVGTLVTRP
jgi:hypothetical protein